MSSYDFLIDNMEWSFSRLNSFYQCPWQFKLQYIDCEQGETNFFSEYGSLIHTILEDYAKNKLEIYELADYYEKIYYDVVKHGAPPNMYVDLEQKYYAAGYDYLFNFEGFGDFEIVEAEKELHFNIGSYRITGFIDLLLRDNEKNFHIYDHKSSTVKSKNSKKAQEYWKQLYLYSIGIYEEYGVYPVKLHINVFKENKIYTIDFDIKEVEKVKQWVIDTIELLKKEEEFLPRSDSFFCNFVCAYRNGICDYIPKQY